MKAATTSVRKNKGISLKTVNKVQEEVFWLAMTKLLHIYMTFAMDSPDLCLAFLKEIVICKNNSMHVPLNLSFDIPFVFSRSGRSDKLL